MAHFYVETATATSQHEAPTIRHIILPLDGSRLAERAIEPAIALARAFGADVSLVRCYELAAHMIPGNTAQFLLNRKPHMSLHAASLYLARMEETFRQRGVPAHSHLYQWSASYAILETTTHSAHALIVMATRAESANQKQIQSVAGDVMDADVAPVFLLSADTHVPFSRGILHGIRVAAVDAPLYPEVAAYAGMLAEQFHGTVAHVASSYISEHKVVGGKGPSVETLQQPHKDMIGIDLVVLKESPQFEEALGGDYALKSLLAAGLPVVVVP